MASETVRQQVTRNLEGHSQVHPAVCMATEIVKGLISILPPPYQLILCDTPVRGQAAKAPKKV